MPSTDYEKSDIQYPGQFKCSEIALISLTGKIAGIKSAVLEMNMYESLFNNFLTGDLTFRDDFNLLDSLPIQGSEYLDFKIRTPIRSSYRDPTTSTTKPGTKTFHDYGGYNFTNVRMAVYKIGTKKPLSDNTQMVTLNFCSPEMIRNQNVRVSRAFDGPYDEAVADLFKKSFGLNSKKKCYIQPTKNNFKFVAPNKRPVDVINMIASRSQPKTSTLPGYVFYENGQGFHFRSMDSFYFNVKAGTDGRATLKPVPEMFEFFCSNPGMSSTNMRNEIPLKQMRHALKFELSDMPDLIRMQRTGTFASKLISYDAYNKTFNTHKHNYIDDFNKMPHLEKGEENIDMVEYNGLAPKTHYDPNDLETADSKSFGRSAYKYITDYSDARIMVTSDTAEVHNTNMDKGYRTNESVQKRQMALEIMKTIQLQLTAHGNTHLNAGHIIRVNLPRPGAGKSEVKSTQYDKNLSGRWLITDVRHKFNFEETTHQSLYTCVKETYSRGQIEDTGPLKITSDNEGMPVNLYDNTEYV